MLLQTPHYSLTTSNDGSTEKLLLNVELPGHRHSWCLTVGSLCSWTLSHGWLCTGVEYSKGIELSVADNRVLLHLPGRYRLVCV
jgi:hypothetical protein